MPWTPRQVEKLRNQIAQPATSPSCSATWQKTAGLSPNRAVCSWSAVRWHSSGARSYSASPYTSSTTAGTSSGLARRIRSSVCMPPILPRGQGSDVALGPLIGAAGAVRLRPLAGPRPVRHAIRRVLQRDHLRQAGIDRRGRLPRESDLVEDGVHLGRVRCVPQRVPRVRRLRRLIPVPLVDPVEVEPEPRQLRDVRQIHLGRRAVPLAERVRDVLQAVDIGDVRNEFLSVHRRPVLVPDQLLADQVDDLADPLGRYEILAVLPDPHGPEGAGPVVHVLEQVPVDRLQMRPVEGARDVNLTTLDLALPDGPVPVLREPQLEEIVQVELVPQDLAAGLPEAGVPFLRGIRGRRRVHVVASPPVTFERVRRRYSAVSIRPDSRST